MVLNNNLLLGIVIAVLSFLSGFFTGYQQRHKEVMENDAKYFSRIDSLLDAEAEGKWKGDVLFIPIEK